VQAEAASAPVTAQEARAAALEFARLIEENFLDPATAARYAAALRAAAARGDYDDAGTAAALARRLTADVQAVAADGHLRIQPAAPGGADGPQPRRVMARPQSAEAGGVVPLEPGPGRPIEEARWLAPGIAYIRFNRFTYDPATSAAVERFMREHVEAETVIFDIRTHGGGGTAEMDVIFPYLFAEETALVRSDTRESVAQAGPAGAAPPSFRTVPGRAGVVSSEHFVRPHPGERRLFDARVLVLTSGYSGSAAEHFALALKATRRATLIGETTAGAGNFAFAGMRPVGERFSAFIPVGRTYDPRTGRGWEGTGVEPDVAVPAEQALVEALVRSGLGRADAERLSAEVRPTGSMRRILPLRGASGA
jgi:hypothetical protein